MTVQERVKQFEELRDRLAEREELATLSLTFVFRQSDYEFWLEYFKGYAEMEREIAQDVLADGAAISASQQWKKHVFFQTLYDAVRFGMIKKLGPKYDKLGREVE